MNRVSNTVSSIMDHVEVAVLDHAYQEHGLAHIVEDGHVAYFDQEDDEQ
ncbi:MAG: hypothetical protein ACN2B6_00970 [Rickettsiales bacterium]